MGSSRWTDDDQIRRKRTPSFQSNESVLSRNAQKHRRWKIICTLLCRWWYDWNCFSHISVNQLSIYGAVSDLCEEYSSCQTRTGRPVVAEQSDPPFRASRLIDNDTHTLNWNSCTRNSFAEAQRSSGRASTTRSIDKDLYWCRIPENSWSRTILHDRTYWQVLTIFRASDMSWVYVTTRWQINWPERLDSREHQNWTRFGSHNQLPAR